MFTQLNNEYLQRIIAVLGLVAVLLIFFFTYRALFKVLKKRVLETPGQLDDFILDLFKFPVLWFFYWVTIKIFTHIFLSGSGIFPMLLHINSLLLIFVVAWIAVQMVKAGAYYLQSKLDVTTSDNLMARKSLTQVKVFKGITNALIVVVSLACALLTFDQARNVGISILTSAGIVGIIVGFAAQKTISLILAGIQIAITQPIRLDDVVVVEGEWGKVEEISLTFVVVKIWDERRLVLPVTWFFEKPFQNWTRNSSEIIGSVMFYADYRFPVQTVREFVPLLLEGNPLWDGRVCSVQVTDMTERHQEIRVLVSSSDSSKNWDLRTEIREKTINYMAINHPEGFVKTRISSTEKTVS